MTTPLDLINLALLDSGIIGVGQTASAEDVNNAFTRLTWMLEQWQRKRYLVFQLVNLQFTSTGASSYTVGPSGDFNIAIRPDKLENGCYFRQLVQSSPNQVDYPLELLESWEDYNRIVLKKLVTFPGYVFYDPGFPLGTVYFWPVAQANIYLMNLLVKTTLSNLIQGGLATVLDATTPPMYFQAIYLSLAEILRTAYRLPMDPALSGRAKESREVVRGASSAIARLRMPDDLIRPGVYNPYSDQITEKEPTMLFRKSTFAALALLASSTLVLATDANIPLYPPGFGAGILDTTLLNRTITQVNLLSAGGCCSGVAGSFTTLAASSTVSGAGFTARFATPGPIGSTVASTGAFTTLTASGQITSTAGTPTISSGGCGATTNGAVVAGSTNQSGHITIGSAATSTCTVNFSATLAAVPGACVIQPENTTAAAVGTTGAYVSAITTAHFVITGTLASANYSFICL